MRYIALGTSASMPTRERGYPGGLFISDGERVLIDCGEGTTRQLIIVGEGPQRVSFVWISHTHLDHYLGIAGLVHCLEVSYPEAELSIYASRPVIDRIEALLALCDLRGMQPSLCVTEGGPFHETKRYVYRTFPVSHTVQTHGLTVEEKPFRRFDAERAEALGVAAGPLRTALAAGEGVVLPNGRSVTPDEVLGRPKEGRKLVYLPDTEACDGLVDECRNADLLICESTYASRNASLATRFKHMTSRQAAQLAVDAGVKRLVLTHVSPREELADIEREARAVFAPTEVAADLSAFSVPTA